MLYCRMDVGLYQTYPKTFILTPPCKTRRPLGGGFFFVDPNLLAIFLSRILVSMPVKNPLAIPFLLG